MVLLSEQQLLDCAQAFDNHGCSGGLPSHAFEYIASSGGLDTEGAYPYLAEESGSCSFDKGGVGAAVIKSVNITFQDEEELLDAVGNVGPVSVAFQVKLPSGNSKRAGHDRKRTRGACWCSVLGARCAPSFAARGDGAGQCLGTR